MQWSRTPSGAGASPRRTAPSGHGHATQRGRRSRPATAPRAWSSAVVAASMSPSATWAAIRPAAHTPGAQQVDGQPAAANDQRQQRANAAQTTAGARAGPDSSGPSASEAAALIEPSQSARGSAPSATPKSRSLPVISLADRQPEEAGRAPSPARRQGVGASAGDAHERRAERDRAEQRREHGHRPQQPGTRQQQRHGRGGRGEDQRGALAVGLGRDEPAAERRSPRASQPIRGSSATASGRHAGGRSGGEGRVGAERLERPEHDAAGERACARRGG